MPKFATVLLTLLLMLLFGGSSRAETEHRIALVIGNGAYQHLPRLANPVNDAQLIAATLESVGFKLIGGKAQIDLDRNSLEAVVRQFGAELAGSTVAMFYYAGHGLAVQGANFLVPIGANPETVADVDFELVDANIVLKQMEGSGSKLNMLVLDACRNNPFGGRGLRDASSGLAPMRAPRGTLISYATQPGNTALDGENGHSPYTAALADWIKRPGLQVFDVFNQVALSVDKATAGRQQPWIATSPLAGAFYFIGSATAPSTSPDMEGLFWQSILQSSNKADYEEYLHQYPQGRFAGLARNRLEKLTAPTPSLGPNLGVAVPQSVAPVNPPHQLEATIIAPTPVTPRTSAPPAPRGGAGVYGAFALAEGSGKYGYSSNQVSQPAADSAALSGCAAGECKIVFRTGHRQCGALATAENSTAWGGAVRARRDRALLAAMQNCRKHTQLGTCKIRGVVCNQ